MKRIFSVIALVLSLVCINGCKCSNKANFAFFKNKVSNIENYRYYVIKQEIYKEDLLLYRENKSVYLNDDKYRIEIDVKEIEEIDSEDLYNERYEEYYQKGTDFYYKENNKWKITESENKFSNIGFLIEEDMMSAYQIKEEKGNKLLIGSLKEDKISSFFGFDIVGATDVTLNVEVDNSDRVTCLSISYTSKNDNKIKVSIDVGYDYVIQFNLPVVQQ